MGDIAKLVFRLKGQIRDFASGLCKGKDVKLTCIGRSLKEKTRLNKVVERLSRNLSKEDFSRRVNRRLVEGSANRVGADTLLVMDETDIKKPYARSMEHLGRIRDGSTGKIGQGYSCMNVLGTNVDGRDVIPLWGQLYSVRSETCGARTRRLLTQFERFQSGFPVAGFGL